MLSVWLVLNELTRPEAWLEAYSFRPGPWICLEFKVLMLTKCDKDWTWTTNTVLLNTFSLFVLWNHDLRLTFLNVVRLFITLNKCNLLLVVYLLRLRSSHSCSSIGRRDFSINFDHWPLCQHHSNWLASPVNLPGMFVARSFLDVLFFSCLHQVPTL